MTAGERLFLGIDGGATRCRARLRDSRGARLGEAEGPPANVYVDFEAAMRVIAETVARAVAAAGLAAADMRRVSAGAGLAGIASPADEARVAARLDDFAAVAVVNDVVTACLGAHAGRDGGVIIAGTGSAAVAQVAGRRFIIGGRGFILGDDGSAARIGYEALRRAVLAHDGIADETPLTRRLMARFGNDPVPLLEWARTAKPSDYGALSPLVFEAAAQGDPVARAVVAAAGEAIAALAGAVRRRGAARIALVGGLADAIRPFLPAASAALFSEPLLDATDGAILLAGGKVASAAGA